MNVTNAGSRRAREVVQVYLSDEYASIAPPVKRLAAFTSVMIAPGETVELDLDIPHAKFGFHGTNGFVIEPGDFRIGVGPLSTKLSLPA